MSTEPSGEDEVERARLSPIARRALAVLREHWHLNDEQVDAIQATTATGGPPTREESLGWDALTRVALLVDIHDALHRLHHSELADAWMTRPNTNALFAGQSPIDAIIGGHAAVFDVRGLLQARLHGG